MERAFNLLNFTTISYLQNLFTKTININKANEYFENRTGILNFFETIDEYAEFTDLLQDRCLIAEPISRREYGDFQTPIELSEKVCTILKERGVNPKIIIEPTFGKGSFILSSLKTFTTIEEIYGIEIYKPYIWETKFQILELFLSNPKINIPKINLINQNIFDFNFNFIENKDLSKELLILGNPPWITNSELCSINSLNLPQKSNFKGFSGLEAMTGKGNFDICEYILLKLFDRFSNYFGTFSMLAKDSVIKNIVYSQKNNRYKIDSLKAIKFDAKKYFGASVKASLFECKLGGPKYELKCDVSVIENPQTIIRSFGWINNKFVYDISLYQNVSKYDNQCPYIWRQGIKHDCSKIMELTKYENNYINGYGEYLEVEDDLIYGLLKSSDLDTLFIDTVERYVIVTQKKTGEDTTYIKTISPKLHKYLKKNEEKFNSRKSSIYKSAYPFSIFGVGDYSFKPYKVAISGFYKRSFFSLVLPHNQKPVMFDDTCYFISFNHLEDAIFCWVLLNSSQCQNLISSIAFIDAKRPYTKEILMRLDIKAIAKEITFSQIRDFCEPYYNNLNIDLSEDSWERFLENIFANRTKTQMSLIK